MPVEDKAAETTTKTWGRKNRPYRALVEVAGTDVHEAALARIRWLWDEFDGHVSVSVSGGKDSTVVMELAAIVAREHGAVLKVQYLDQEAEWQATRDYLRRLKDTRLDLDIDWYQIPFRLFNAASHEEESEFGHMWPDGHPDDFYVRPPEPDAIRVNDFGKDRFKDVLGAMNARAGGVHLTGMRAEESPLRRLSMTGRPAYKWATWGAGGGAAFLMHPIYDWSFRDVWHAIETYGWDHNTVYDALFRYGVPHRDMRVSSLIHSGAVRHLDQVQEIESETWNALARRFSGANAVAHVGEDIMAEYRVRRPYMFDSWLEYVEYLIDTLVEPEHRGKFRNQIVLAKRALPWMTLDRIAQKILPSVMKNDYFNDYSFAKWLQASKRFAADWEEANGRALPEDSHDALYTA